jgi:glycosyltransferase involved in cell wall biosynthesis
VILTFVRHYLPGFRAGGPIRSIANLVEALGDEFEFRVLTLDRDFGDREPYPAVAPERWTSVGKAWVMYVQPKRLGLQKVAAIAGDTPHDLIYLNSFFDRRFTQQVLLARMMRRLPKCPVVIAPRGELSEGALQIKHRRKRAYIAITRWLGLYTASTWQATSSDEAAQIRRHVNVPDSCIILASNVGSVSARNEYEQSRLQRLPGAPLRVCFLSRISRKKNLDYALRVLAQVHVPVHFTIYGPVEDAKYWNECRELLAKLPLHVSAMHAGELRHADVERALGGHDVFFLPTRSENFGHVIQEALRAGLAILSSDQTPWRDLEVHGVGWALSLGNEKAFVYALEEAFRWDASRLEKARASAIAYAAKMNDSKVTLDASRHLFRHALATAPRST